MTKTYDMNEVEKTVIGRFNAQLQDAIAAVRKVEGAREGAAQAFIATRGIKNDKVFVDFDNMRFSCEEPDPSPAPTPAAAPIPEPMPYQDYGAVLDASERP